MRVLAVNGSPHKEGFCKKILNRIIEGVVEKEAIVELVDLSDKTVKPCLACRNAECWESMKCNLTDDGLELRRLFNECDALVFAAPVYFLSVNGLAKNFMDRMRNYRGDVRPSVALAVAGGTGKGCVTALQEVCRWMVLVGFSPVVAEPVTRYNLDLAMGWAKSWGVMLVEKTLSEKRGDLYSRLSEFERLPYMRYTVTDEILYLARSAVDALLRRSVVEETAELARLVEEAETRLRLGDSENGLRLAVEAHEKSMRLFNRLTQPSG
ncbi:MAG: flavodoxin family protein [Candidatus Brockarchaeota archaeon]|nr:flavodoxin family protein [Candidatus Brockarchaeota archaeon]